MGKRLGRSVCQYIIRELIVIDNSQLMNDATICWHRNPTTTARAARLVKGVAKGFVRMACSFSTTTIQVDPPADPSGHHGFNMFQWSDVEYDV